MLLPYHKAVVRNEEHRNQCHRCQNSSDLVNRELDVKLTITKTKIKLKKIFQMF